jgi:peptide chain release factor 3
LSTKAEKRADVQQICLSGDSDALKNEINDDELYKKLLEHAELLDELIPPMDIDRIMAGDQSPMFFGLALTNFSVQLFWTSFLKWVPNHSDHLLI